LFSSVHTCSPLPAFFENFLMSTSKTSNSEHRMEEGEPPRPLGGYEGEGDVPTGRLYREAGGGMGELRLFGKLRNPGSQMAPKIGGILRHLAPLCGYSRIIWKYFFSTRVREPGGSESGVAHLNSSKLP
jgi:hypothetical protein